MSWVSYPVLIQNTDIELSTVIAPVLPKRLFLAVRVGSYAAAAKTLNTVGWY